MTALHLQLTQGTMAAAAQMIHDVPCFRRLAGADARTVVAAVRREVNANVPRYADEWRDGLDVTLASRVLAVQCAETARNALNSVLDADLRAAREGRAA